MKTQDVAELIDFEVLIPTADGMKIAERVTIKVPIERDRETGDEILTPEALDLIQTTQARYMGLMTPEDFLQLRKRYGLTQKQMAELLQVGAKSYTRWETGRERPSRVINLLLCAIRDGELRLEYLREQRRQPGAPLRRDPVNASWWDESRRPRVVIPAAHEFAIEEPAELKAA